MGQPWGRAPMSRRERIKTVSKVERRKRIITYVTVEKQVVALGPVAAAFARAMRMARSDAHRAFDTALREHADAIRSEAR